MKKVPSELLSVMEEIERDKSLWRRVAGLNGARFEIRFCCNSQIVRRTLVQQKGSAVVFNGPMERTGEMPRELQIIMDRCENDGELHAIVAAFERGKFDIVFICSGFDLRDVLIQEVS